MRHEKTSNLFGAVVAGTCFFVGVSDVPLFGPSSAYALPISLGPFRDMAPFTDVNRMGPDGSQIRIVKNPNTFGVTGRLPSGERIRIGQIEPGEPRASHQAFLADPNNPASGSRITLRGVGGPLNANTNHATEVAGILIGGTFTPVGFPTITGLASEASLFSTGYTVFTRPGNAADFLGVPPPPPPAGTPRRGVNFLTDNNVSVINMSGGFYTPLPAPQFFLMGEGGAGAEALIVDRTVRERNVVWVKSAGNCGSASPDCSRAGPNTITVPGDAFNAITVGGTGQDTAGNASQDFTRVGNFSSRGPTGDGRHKPDIVAPGGRIFMPSGGSDTDTQTASGTSFAAPHVAGTAALLVERSQEVGLNHDHLTIKSVILNSASKHVRDPQNADRTWPQFRGESTFYTDPLDNAMGVGQLNGSAAVRQLQRVGKPGLGLTVEESAIARGETRDEPLNSGKVLHAGALVTATLTWDREVTLKPGQPGSDVADYNVRSLPNLNLLLVNGTTQAEIAGSISVVDNVEHIYFNVPTTDKYNLRIVNRSTDQDPTFALAFSAASTEGLSFSVDGGVFNTRPGLRGNNPLPPRGQGESPAANPAEGLMAPFGKNKFPNDVNALGIAGPGNFPTEGEIFVSGLDGTNMQRFSGTLGTRSRVGPHNGPPAAMSVLNQGVAGLPPGDRLGVLGLQPDDNVSGLSWGTDGTLGKPSVLLFSVDPDTQGERGDVRFQAIASPMGGAPSTPFPDNPGGGNQFLGQEAAGDIFKSQKFDPFSLVYDSPFLAPAPLRSNELFADEEKLGLQAPKGRGTLLAGEEDDLDALEMDSVFALPQPFDPAHPGHGAVDPDGNGLHDEAIFFLLDRWSPSLSTVFGRTPDDIFVSLVPFTNGRFADGETDIRLTKGDALDALVLSDSFPFGLFNNNGDEALFSLDRFSPSITGKGACPSEVYYTDFKREFDPRKDWKAGGSLFASEGALGLMCTVDNIDALDIRRVLAVVAEPSMLALVAIGFAAFAPFLRRRKCASGSLKGGQRMRLSC